MIANKLSGLFSTINPQWFGAIGDGINDDAPAIQAALNLALSKKYPVRIPPGIYLIGSELVTGGECFIWGELAQLKAASQINSVLHHNKPGKLRIDGLSIDGGSLAGNGIKNSAGIVQGSSIRGVAIVNCLECGWDVQDYIYNMHIDQMRISGGNYGIYVDSRKTLTNGARFTNLRVSNTHKWAVRLANNASSRASVAFDSPTIEGNNGGAFYAKNTNVLLSQPYFESNGKRSGDADIEISTQNNVPTKVTSQSTIWGPGGPAQKKTINDKTGPVRVVFSNTHCIFAEIMPSSCSYILNANNHTVGSRVLIFDIDTPIIENYSDNHVLMASFE